MRALFFPRSRLDQREALARRIEPRLRHAELLFGLVQLRARDDRFSEQIPPPVDVQPDVVENRGSFPYGGFRIAAFLVAGAGVDAASVRLTQLERRFGRRDSRSKIGVLDHGQNLPACDAVAFVDEYLLQTPADLRRDADLF